MNFYQNDIKKTLNLLNSSENGLTTNQAKTILQADGPNQLEQKKKTPALLIFFHQFLNPLVYLLVAAASIKAIVKGPIDALTIIVVLLFMAIVGFIQEFKAGKAMDALLQLTSPKAKVKRNGQLIIVDAKDLVKGDIIYFESGDKIPADSQLIESVSLRVNESSLTGESLPVEKNSTVIEKDCPLGERKNMVFTSTAVVSGRGSAVVTATGMATEIGKIANAVRSVKEEKTSLQRSIDQLGKSLIWIVLSFCTILIVLGILKEMTLVDIFMLAVAAAVAAVPEGLPAVVTVALASGMQRMARHHAIMRKLMAVETLGSTTVICSDKTGTLTMNQMTVKTVFTKESFYEVTGEGYEPKGNFIFNNNVLSNPQKKEDLELCLRAGMLCNNASLRNNKGVFEIVGDPTEGALLVAALKAGIDLENINRIMPRINEIPFESDKQYMVTQHQYEKKSVTYIKGSLERLTSFASNIDDIDTFTLATATMANQALRVIALGVVMIEADQLSEDSLIGKVKIIGLCGIIDPPREEAKQAISACYKGGINVVMATGDHMITAKAIANTLNIKGKECVSGSQLNTMSDEELDQLIENVGVFARIEPLHKMRIIQAFKRRGHIVAMTGDGVNDAPALEAADIGIAMGITGTDVAKESADMVLANDNFASIVTAIEEGRAIFNRLRNVVFFLMTTCFGELFALILAIAIVGQSPLIPIQILWINLVTGGLLAIPLGSEPRIGNELNYPPKNPQVGLIYRGMILRIISLSALLSIGVFGVFYWTLLNYTLQEARTMAFCSIVVFEWFLAFNARSDERTVFQLGLFKNRWLFFMILIGLLLQLAVVYHPFLNKLFDTVPLKPFELGIVILPGLSVFILESLRKKFFPQLFTNGKWTK